MNTLPPAPVNHSTHPGAEQNDVAQYHNLFERHPQPMWVYDIETLAFLAVNDAAVHCYGYTRAEFLSMTIKDIRPPEDIPALLKDISTNEPGYAQSGVWRHRTKAGDLLDVEILSHTIVLKGRRARLVLANDITARRRAEAELLESQTRLKLLNSIAIRMTSGVPVAHVIVSLIRQIAEYFSDYRVSFSIIDESGHLTVVESVEPPGMAGLVGLTANLALAPRFTAALRAHEAVIIGDIARDDRLASLAPVFAAAGTAALLGVPVYRAGEPQLVGLLCFDAPQPRVWSAHESATLGEIAEYLSIALGDAHNHQERKRAEEALRKSEATNRALVSAIPDLMFRHSRDGVYLDYHAPRGIGLLVPPSEFLGKRVDEILPPALAQQMLHSIECALATGETQVFEYQLPLPDSAGPGQFEARLVPCGAEEVLAIIRDVTERKRLESQLLQIQKIETVGQLAGGVAHDFNNLLTAIIGYADLAMSALAPEAQAIGDLEEIRRAADRATALTRQLLAFARRQMIELRPIQLNDLVLDLYKLLRRLIGEHIELSMLPGVSVGWANVDPGQIEQVLVNLAVNARDAMPDGGRLTIATSIERFDQEAARRHAGAAVGDYVVITVSDTGVGMDEYVRAHLFEPFFTTKERGRGTGLGLATCYGIVEQHGGLIDVDSAPGQGTTVSVYLPNIIAPGATLAQQEDTRRLPRGTETILLVEDEPAVRALAARVLRGQGYVVLEAENGDEALSIARGRGQARLDLLLTDVVMPGMSGKTLAERLTAALPDVRVLFTSGYTGDTSLYESEAGVGFAFLQKPFTRATLARKVREVLDS